ncbi:RCC1 domain-containing protein [Cellulomonas endometrii]|uniref:RCC1 domain-containing protein n=1 Tax=Cellulomonas endometrii TaxID=3036301 RepID=UPI0024ADF4A4|nr:hypothetical protein [Cellulomonas endometrii]
MRPADLARALPTRTAARGSRARLRSTAAALLVALLAAAPAAVAAPVPDAGSTAGGTRVELEVPGSTYALVGAGAATSFAVTDDGRLWGTGRNDHGQLGDGTTTDRTVRTPVTGVPGTITEITGGSAHTLARTADGRVWSWGLGSSGQLGNGASSSRATPGQVGGFGGHDVLTVSAGDAHNLAVDALGRPWAWGSNSHGQLGYTTSVPGASLPVGVPTMAGRTITAVAAGASHSLALQDDGTVWAWGRGDYGQLGDGQGTSTEVPVQATGWGARTVVAIAAGGDTSAAVASDGTLWMWGAGGWGQLGDGAIGSSAASAQQVTALAGVRVTSVALSTTTAVALGADGSVWTWGGVGTLGDPSRLLGDAPRKVAVLAGSTVTAVAAEGFHASALTDAGTLWSWGLNTSGAIGDGTTGDAGLPVRARSPLQVREARFDGLAGTDLEALDDARSP